MYVPETVTWQSYILIILQTPSFFANIRFYKIWTYKKSSGLQTCINLVIAIIIFVLGLPINMVRVVKFWYTMFLILKFDFINFEYHYIELQKKYI